MKRLICCAGFILALSGSLVAQEFPVETIFENGEKEYRINLVFLSDGYKQSELDQFITDVNGVLEDIFKQSPFKEYKTYFNAYAIKVPSNQSGADHPQNTPDTDCDPVPIMSVDNYFGSTFDYAGIHRLLVPVNSTALADVLADNFPTYDQAFILVNSEYYGGSGGHYATSSTNIASSEVSIHEIGHSFAFLADEYWIPSQGEAPNRTTVSSPATVKWKNWIGKNNISVFEYQAGAGWYRPHQNCKMRFLDVPFCSVCKEAFVERIHAFVNPFIDYAPVEAEFDLNEGSVDLSLELLPPTPNTMKITWKRNGNEMKNKRNLQQVTIPATTLAGETTFEAIIMDTTELTRSNAHKTNHVYSVTWTISSNSITGIEVSSAKAEYEISVYPNPVIDVLNLSYSLSKDSQVSVSFSDITGKRTRKLVDEKQHAGKHLYQVKASDLNMNASGLYYMDLTINGIKVVEKLVRP